MRYQYTSSGFRNAFRITANNLPEGVKLLLILNTVIYLITVISGVKYELFYSNFGLVPVKLWKGWMIWQPLTYLFLHGNFIHLLFNMFVLWMFGKDLENEWGKRAFYQYYFVSGIGAGIITSLFSFGSYTPVIGASGANYGLLLAYGLMYPNRMVYLYGIFPVKVKFMVLALAVIAFFASMTSPNSTTSHITHIGGMVIGFLFLNFKINAYNFKLWFINNKIQNLNKRMKKDDFADQELRKSVDKILEKLNEEGWNGLTEKEQQILHEASQRFQQNRPPN